MYPMVRARMTAINSKPSESLKFKADNARGFLEREQNLTWASRLMEDNQLVAGHWWTEADFGKPLVSISSEYQEALQLELGDTLRFDIAGEALTVRVASIRKVRWDSFRPNFFLVFPPGSAGGRGGHLHDQRLSHARTASGTGRSGAAVPDRVGVRRGRHPQADSRHHRSRDPGGAVRVSVHAGGRHRGAARRGAIDAR